MRKMNELRVEIALEIIQKKIVHLLKNNKGDDMNTIKESLKTLVDEREKIYDLDKDTINKYCKELANFIEKELNK